MKDKQGNEIEITFERSYPPLRFGNKEEARLATMTQRLQTFAGDVGYVVLHAAWDPSVKADYDKIMDQLDRTVQLERDQLKLAFNKLICDEKKQIVVKEDDYLWQGLVTIIHQWIKINRQFPYSDHPEFDSIGFEMACETLCSFYNVDCPARKEALNWLEPYLPHLNEMTEERDELYVDRLEAAEALLRALGCTWDEGQEGMFLWGRLPAGSPDAAAVIDDLLYGKHVFLAPGFIFGEKGKRYVRISLCTPKERIWEAVERVTGNNK